MAEQGQDCIHRILEGMPEYAFIWILDQNGVICLQWMNQHASDAVRKWSIDARTGMPIDRIFALPKQVIDQIGSVFTTSKPYHRTIDCSQMKIPSNRRMVMHVCGIDSSRMLMRIKTEDDRDVLIEELERRNKLLNALFEASVDTHVLADQEGNIFMANPAAPKMFGYDSYEEFIRIKTPDLYAKNDSRLQVLEKACRTDQVVERIIARRKDGTMFPGLLSACKLVFENQVFFYGILKDISEYEELMDVVKKIDTNYHNLFEFFNSGLVLIGKKKEILLCNQTAQQILGIEGNHLHKSIDRLDDNGVHYKWIHELDKLLSSPVGYINRFSIVYANDQKLFYRLKTHSMPDGILVEIHEETQDRKLEEEKERIKRMEIMGQIAGQISHDFNNLLSPLIGVPEVIKRRMSGDPQSIRLINMIQTAANQMIHINQQLSMLSRCGRYVFNLVDLNQMIHDAISMVNIPAAVSLTYDLSDGLFKISGDETQLTRVLVNLINNAIEAMEGNGRIQLKSKNICIDKKHPEHGNIPPGDYSMISISDTGCGINTDISERIFDPFFTTKKTVQRKGLGLGLSGVREVVMDHRGFVDFESNPGAGTTFHLFYPRSHVSEQKHLTHLPRSRDAETIIVVDDNSVYLDIMEEMLRDLGYHVVTDTSPGHALDAIKSKPYSLAILDMNLGDIDGMELLNMIREVIPDQKAILISAYTDPQKIEQALNSGFKYCISKPVEYSELAQVIRSVLDEK